MAETGQSGHVQEPKNFTPKDPPKLDPPKDEPISLGELAKCDGTTVIIFLRSMEMGPNLG